MGSIFARLFTGFGKKEVKIIMVGLDAAGKTTLLYWLKLGEVVTTCPTIGFNVETVCHRNIDFMVWDIGANEKTRGLWRHYYEGAQGIIFVVDASDRERIGEAAKEFQKVLRENDLRDTVLLVVANKQDLPQALAVDEVSEKLELPLGTIPWHIQPTCATSGEGLKEGLDWIANALQNK